MSERRAKTRTFDLTDQARRRKRVISGELRKRSLWFVSLRWWVPPAVGAGALAARLLGVDFPETPVVATAFFILLYNLALHTAGRGLEKEGELTTVQRFTYLQVGLDYAAMFALIHFTGGAASPLIFFFIFHIIFASILLPPSSAYGFAALASAGMAAIAFFERAGIVEHHALFFNGKAIDLAQQPFHMAVELAFFTASVFITAYSTTSIVKMLRKRIVRLAEMTEAVSSLNDQLAALYSMIGAIGSTRDMKVVLEVATRELARVMAVEGVSVKFLSDDGKRLEYAAAVGLPDELVKARGVDISRSHLNQRVLEGEPYVTGRLDRAESFQFGEDLVRAGFHSVLFAPLTVESKVIGALGAYCKQADRFTPDEVKFFLLAAGIVAIAVENVRAYQSIEALGVERSKSMFRVAHNLRAPLAAIISMIDVLKSGYYGELNDGQREQIRRVERRSRTMLDTVGDLMSLAGAKGHLKKPEMGPIDLSVLAGRIERTFIDEAREAGVSFHVVKKENIEKARGNLQLLEQMLENLVSNAIKYTPQGGKVTVTFSTDAEGQPAIEVSDDGIGIPSRDRDRLFTEFFRADNAKSKHELGTGLGLAIVKDIVNQHGGRVVVESEEGMGTIFVVHLCGAGKGEK